MYSLNSRVSFKSANESGFNSVRMWAEAEHFRYDKVAEVSKGQVFAMTGRRDNATNDIHVDVETYVHVRPLS